KRSVAVSRRCLGQTMARPTLSIVIPTIGRPADLQNCLLSIRAMASDDLMQVIIVDDAAAARVSCDVDFPTYVDVQVLRINQPVGPARSRNIGAVAAGGDIIGFLDDDARVSPGWASVVTSSLTTECVAITGPVFGFDRTLLARARQQRYEARYAGRRDGESV